MIVVTEMIFTLPINARDRIERHCSAFGSHEVINRAMRIGPQQRSQGTSIVDPLANILFGRIRVLRYHRHMPLSLPIRTARQARTNFSEIPDRRYMLVKIPHLPERDRH